MRIDRSRFSPRAHRRPRPRRGRKAVPETGDCSGRAGSADSAAFPAYFLEPLRFEGEVFLAFLAARRAGSFTIARSCYSPASRSVGPPLATSACIFYKHAQPRLHRFDRRYPRHACARCLCVRPGSPRPARQRGLRPARGGDRRRACAVRGNDREPNRSPAIDPRSPSSRAPLSSSHPIAAARYGHERRSHGRDARRLKDADRRDVGQYPTSARAPELRTAARSMVAPEGEVWNLNYVGLSASSRGQRPFFGGRLTRGGGSSGSKYGTTRILDFNVGHPRRGVRRHYERSARFAEGSSAASW